MVNTLNKAVWLLAAALITGLAPVQPANALSADEYFADGNRLFRDDLYWAALLRYQQAADEGLNSALLHYNMGVAHYRAGQHARAGEALLLALNDSGLRDATHYNLGLNAYALGETEEALQWFRLVRDQNQNEKLSDYAVIAISRILDEQREPDEFEIRIVEREEKRDFVDIDFRVRVGFGQDDNIFRSPNQPYIDFSDAAQPVVVPVVASGAFMPVSLISRYQINSFKYEGFYVGYRASGRYYQDKELENGNQYMHEASFGNHYRRKEGSRERELYSSFRVAQNNEVYYDPDDGGSRDIGTVNIDDRMNYLRYGPEFAFRQSHEKLAVGARFKAQLWNYEDTVVVPEYDNEFLILSLYGQYRFAPTSLIRVTAEGYTRRFGDRPSYDLDGIQRQGNPEVIYNYYSLKLTARQRVFSSFWFGFDLARTVRKDDYLGYNDYTRDSVGVDIHWSPGYRFDLEAAGVYRLYDYPNAFAFHVDTLPRKTQETADISLTASYRITDHLSLVAEARYRETVSNDTRIQYERNQFVLGVRWEQ